MNISRLHTFRASRQTRIRRYGALLLVSLAFSLRLLAAEEDDNPWAKISKKLVISNVTLQLTNLEVHVTGRNVDETLPWDMSGIGEHFCAMRKPFATPHMEDGYILRNAGYYAFKDDDDFTVTNIQRFAFFTNRPTTIGLVAGHAGGDGGSWQEMLLVDVETGAHIRINLNDGFMPQRLELTNFQPAFITREFFGLKGWDKGCLGQAYRFKDGRYCAFR